MSRGGAPAPRLLVLHDDPEPFVDLLRERFPDLSWQTCTSEDAVSRRLAEVEPEIVYSIKCPGIPGPAHRTILECPSLAWIQVGGAGVDHLVPWDSQRLAVTNCAGVLSPFMAEYVLGAILMCNFGFPTYRRQQQAALWRQNDWTAAAGKTLLIVGLGRIGQQTAKLAKAVGLRVIGMRQRPEIPKAVDAVFPPDRLHHVLAEADFVVLHVPLTEATHHLIDAAALACMKPSAILINCARGPVVDEAALIAALDAGQLSGAVLDVFAEEPLAADSPLWALDEVIVTPHVSDSVADWQQRFAGFFADNLERWLAGRPLENVVDPSRGY